MFEVSVIDWLGSKKVNNYLIYYLYFFKNVDDYKNNPEYAKYKIDYFYIPKLYLIVNKEPIFVGNSQVGNSPTTLVNDLYMHLMDEDSTNVKLLFDDLTIKLKNDTLSYKNMK